MGSEDHQAMNSKDDVDSKEEVGSKADAGSKDDFDSKDDIDSKASFLTLPAEIRNKIYAYVLYAGRRGLMFSHRHRPDGHGPSRISGTVPMTSFIIPWPSDRCDYITWIPWIYEDTFNPLKYVCKQLYNETAHLELEHNTVTFQGHWGSGLPPPHILLDRDFSTINSVKLDRCKGIVIAAHPFPSSWEMQPDTRGRGMQWRPSFDIREYSTKDDLDAFACVARFCRAHPKVPVKYVCLEWQPGSALMWSDPWDFIRQGVLLNYVLRGRDLSSWLIGSGEAGASIREIATGVLEGRDRREWKADNLRFFPVQTAFNESRFRREAEKSLMMIPEVQCSVDEWVRVAKVWTEEGI